MALANDEREQAEEACRRAEESFLAGNIASAQLSARMAQLMCPSLPGVANALAAYDIHAANPGDWFAVLGIYRSSGKTITRDAINKQFRHLSLLVHPDKNRSAAADGAFKLLRQAHKELSDLAPIPAPKPNPRPNADDANTKANAETEVEKHKRWWGEYWDWNPDFSEEDASTRHDTGAADEEPTPRKRSKPSSPTKKPPPPPKPQEFPCPCKCPWCSTQFASMVSAGRWQIKCEACSKISLVNVEGPDMATCSI
uniref:J domain-containing protein n=1 Tax=Leersia perrieri TaxID=77586 RepID=A0A0D9X1R9_9ORYZ